MYSYGAVYHLRITKIFSLPLISGSKGMCCIMILFNVIICFFGFTYLFHGKTPLAYFGQLDIFFWLERLYNLHKRKRKPSRIGLLFYPVADYFITQLSGCNFLIKYLEWGLPSSLPRCNASRNCGMITLLTVTDKLIMNRRRCSTKYDLVKHSSLLAIEVHPVKADPLIHDSFIGVSASAPSLNSCFHCSSTNSRTVQIPESLLYCHLTPCLAPCFAWWMGCPSSVCISVCVSVRSSPLTSQ